MAGITIRIPDAVYDKYKAMHPSNPTHAIETQVIRFQDNLYKDRTLIFPDEARSALEKLFGRPIEDPMGFAKWLQDLISMKIGDLAFILKPGQLKNLHGKAKFFGKEFTEFARPYLSRILDRDLGGF